VGYHALLGGTNYIGLYKIGIFDQKGYNVTKWQHAKHFRHSYSYHSYAWFTG